MRWPLWSITLRALCSHQRNNNMKTKTVAALLAIPLIVATLAAYVHWSRSFDMSQGALYGTLSKDEVASLVKQANEASDNTARRLLLQHFSSHEQQRAAPETAQVAVRHWSTEVFKFGDASDKELALDLLWRQDACAIVDNAGYQSALPKLQSLQLATLNEIRRQCSAPSTKGP
jgi:hypothetical protein